MKETFARSSVSCLTGGDLQSITAVRGDPCWQVTQQLHLLIEKVSSGDTGRENMAVCGHFLSLIEQSDLYVSVFVGQD